jgi:3-methylfumaryl-CoA hydratase
MNEHSDVAANDLDVEKLQTWVGRVRMQTDLASRVPLQRLAGLLDHELPPWQEGVVPPLGHWLYFLEHARQSSLEVDGHSKRGDFLPPVPLPRRMWAASRVTFLASVPLGADMARRSTIAAVTAKHGRSGPMVFVTVRHEVLLGEIVALVEDQHIVYRMPPDSSKSLPAAPTPAAPPAAAPQSDSTRMIIPGPVSLFRFSALTFNAHRIHYDRDYARDAEGYPGLVVHGPWVAILLMDHFLRQAPGRNVMSFSFRAERPLFDTAPFNVCLRMTDSGADLWAADREGATALSAVVEAG